MKQKQIKTSDMHFIMSLLKYNTGWCFYHETFIISKSINVFENIFLHSIELLKKGFY